MKREPNEIDVGRYSYGLQNVKMLWPQADVKIGSFCSIAPGVKLLLGSNHRTDWLTTFPFGHIYEDKFGAEKVEGHPATNGNIVIGNDVWIAYGVTIMFGVTIGDGAVIAANSHVCKDVKPYEIVGGNPARHIRFRFTDEIIELMLRLKWWDLPDKEIKELIPILMAKPDLDKLKSLVDKHAA